MEHITVIEDDQEQSENLCDLLRRRGYCVSVFANKTDALYFLETEPTDLVLLDIILQGEYDAGFDIAQVLLRHRADLPIIFLTERTQEMDQISGLRLGAADYMPKPILLEVLALKVSKLLQAAKARKLEPSDARDRLVQGALEIRMDSYEVFWKGRLVSLTLTETGILSRLAKRPGLVLTLDQLAEQSRTGIVEKNTIATHIKNIRRKLKSVDAEFDGIESVYGAGYKWRA